MKFQITPELTPNPASMAFRLNHSITESPIVFENATAAEASPLASKLFGFPWVTSVMIGQSFIQITKADWVDWSMLEAPLSELLKEHLESNEPLFVEVKATNSVEANDIQESDSEIIKQIKTILNQEIRPAVAMDGGDIVFHSYDQNKLYIHMKGSCAGCPSSTMTLKMGIEARFKEVLPEIDEVVAL